MRSEDPPETRPDDMLALLSCDCDPEQGRHTCDAPPGDVAE